MPRKAKTSNAKPESKSAFIRARLNLTPKETQAQAKEAGIKISDAMIYSIRSEAKRKGASTVKSKPGPKPKSQPGAAVGGLETMIRAIVREEIKRFFAER